jgi:hypothetical protein
MIARDAPVTDTLAAIVRLAELLEPATIAGAFVPASYRYRLGDLSRGQGSKSPLETTDDKANTSLVVWTAMVDWLMRRAHPPNYLQPRR